MKKSTVRRLLVLCLCLTMVTVSLVGGTLAKYTTSASGADDARVAKWGVVITANGTTFADAYNTDDKNITTITQSVVTAGTEGDAVVAPGTSGAMVAMTLEGIPEVAVNVKYEATVTLTDWVDGDGNFYCPIVFTVNGKEIKQDATNDSAEKLAAAVKAAIDGYSANYGPNQNLATEATVATPDVSWSWPFHVSDANDVKDTALGNATKAAEVSLSVVTTVTQID